MGVDGVDEETMSGGEMGLETREGEGKGKGRVVLVGGDGNDNAIFTFNANIMRMFNTGLGAKDFEQD